MTIEDIIAMINGCGYSIALRQFNKLKVNNEALWEACATRIDSSDARNHPKHVYMDEISFGRDPIVALTKVYNKCHAAKHAPVVDVFDEMEDDDVFA